MTMERFLFRLGSPLEASRALANRGEVLFNNEAYEDALKPLKKAIALYERVEGFIQIQRRLRGKPPLDPPHHVGRSYELLACTHLNLGHDKRAIRYYRRYIKVMKRFYPESPTTVALACKASGDTLLAKRQHIRVAIDLFQEGTQLLEAKPSRSDRDNELLRSMYFSLGYAYDDLDADRSFYNYQRSIEFEQLVGEPAGIVERQAHNGYLCFAFFRKGRLAEAITYMKRLAKVYEEIAPRTLMLAHCYLGLGLWLKECGRAQESLDYFQASVATFVALLPGPGFDMDAVLVRQIHRELGYSLYEAGSIDDTVLLGEVFRDLGYVYGEIGNIDECQTFLKRAIAIFTEKDPKSEFLSRSYCWFARVLLQQDAFDDAILYLHKASKIEIAREKSRGCCNPTVITDIYRALVAAYRTRGDYNQATTYVQRAIAVLEHCQATAFVPLRLAKCYKLLGILYDEQSIYFQAILYYQKAMTMYEEANPGYLDFEIYQKLGIAVAALTNHR